MGIVSHHAASSLDNITGFYCLLSDRTTHARCRHCMRFLMGYVTALLVFNVFIKYLYWLHDHIIVLFTAIRATKVKLGEPCNEHCCRLLFGGYAVLVLPRSCSFCRAKHLSHSVAKYVSGVERQLFPSALRAFNNHSAPAPFRAHWYQKHGSAFAPWLKYFSMFEMLCS